MIEVRHVAEKKSDVPIEHKEHRPSACNVQVPREQAPHLRFPPKKIQVHRFDQKKHLTYRPDKVYPDPWVAMPRSQEPPLLIAEIPQERPSKEEHLQRGDCADHVEICCVLPTEYIGRGSASITVIYERQSTCCGAVGEVRVIRGIHQRHMRNISASSAL